MTYQGVVRVAIDALVFAPDYSSCNYNINTAKVARLKQIFELEGCNRYDPQNLITGSIAQDVLQKALVRSHLTSESLLREGEPPILHLPPNTYVRCDQGRSRVKALMETEGLFHWWTLELFAGESKIPFPRREEINIAREDTDQKALNKISEESMSEGNFSDGHICAEIVQNRFKTTVEKKWWARLSRSKAGILKRLLDHKSLAAPFLELIHCIPAMREDLMIGVWHKIMAARCDEVPEAPRLTMYTN